MKILLASAAALSLMTAAAFAQTSTSSSTNSSSNQPSAAQAATAQKIKSDLQSAGFQDVNVAPESFLVQAKTKDGDPVVMTIGPHGMTMVEALGKSSSSNTSSSNTSTQNGAPSSSTSK